MLDVTFCAQKLHPESPQACGIASRSAGTGSLPLPAHAAGRGRDLSAHPDNHSTAAVQPWPESGRILPSGGRPEQVSEQELSRFRAEDMDTSWGRHAAGRVILVREAG